MNKKIYKGASLLFSGDPILFVSFPLIRGRRQIRKRGFASLKLTREKETIEEQTKYNKGSRRGAKPLSTTTSPSHLKERGIKGVR